MIFLATLIFFVTLITDLITDYMLYLKGKPVKHFSGAILRFIGLIPAGFFFSYYHGDIVFLRLITAIPMMLLTYWVLMDSIFGKLIGQGFGYLGTTSALDRLQRKNTWLVWAKYIGAVVSIAAYIFVV